MRKPHSSGQADMIGEPRTLSKGGFASKIGVSPGRVSQMIAKGLPVEADGTIDVARGRLWVQENVDPARSAAQAGQGQGLLPFADQRQRNTLTEEKTRLAKEQADAAELRNRVLRAELVKAADVEREWSGLLRKLRSGILAAPSRIRQQLPHLTAHDAQVIDDELRRVLEDLAHED